MAPKLPRSATPLSEVDVETSGVSDYLKDLGYTLRSRKTGVRELDAAWPTKKKGGAGSGQPDLFLFNDDNKDSYPLVVWENKGTATGVDVALSEAKGYVEGAHALLRGKPNLPRVAVGYDGTNLRAAFLTSDSRWISLKLDGVIVIDDFVPAQTLARGVRSDGSIVDDAAKLDARILRGVLEQLKTLYRGIPALKSGRRPIDFTVALLTLRLVVERKKWGSWSEQPSLVPDVSDLDQQVAERLKQLVSRCMADDDLKNSYGSIFKFSEQDETEAEVAFDFEAVLKSIPTGKDVFRRLFELIDSLPLLHGADIDIFGEVYQSIGDDAVKRAFGEYFTGRHIISGVVAPFLKRAGVASFDASLKDKTVADIAAGTGGFLTETLRFVRREFKLDEEAAAAFAQSAFFGYDLSASNASRARVNMYFAGDGFSVIEGGVDSLDKKAARGPGKRQFDFILTNPPYGSSAAHHLLHEAFLQRVVALLKPGTGWGLVVLPTGSLENPRSSAARLELLRTARVTDVISLPKHAFAPYTMQRTAIVFFQRRPTPLSATTWSEILDQAGNEKIALFIVDSDGYANSDKRFPTRRVGPDGSWVHDDLAQWVGADGRMRVGKLFDALINENAPSVGEFGPKYMRASLKELAAAMAAWGADRGSGIELLPDNFLRSAGESVSPTEYIARVEVLQKRLRGEVELATPPIMEEVKSLMQSTIDFSASGASTRTIGSLLDVKKGNPSLTEAAIYEAHEDGGIPVYGGGVSAASSHVKETAKTAAGKRITVFEGPAILLSVDGSSGAMQVIEAGKFASNHHAAVLTLKAGETAELDLVAQQAEARLRRLASNKSASATLTLGTIRSLTIDLPTDKSVAADVGSARAALTKIRRLIG